MSAVLSARGGHPDTLPSFALALAMHAALVVAMWFTVQWHTSVATPAVAELWQLPPPTPLAEVAPPEPPAPQLPAPVAEKPAAADIVVQQEHRAEKEPRARPEREPRRNEPAPPPRPAPQDTERAQEDAQERQQAEVARLASQAGPQPRTPSVASTGPVSHAYADRVSTAVRSHLSFPVPEGVGNKVYAEFLIALLPTGELAGEPQLLHPSGLAGWDEAARSAILRTNPFPRDDNGTVPRTMNLKLYPVENR